MEKEYLEGNEKFPATWKTHVCANCGASVYHKDAVYCEERKKFFCSETCKKKFEEPD